MMFLLAALNASAQKLSIENEVINVGQVLYRVPVKAEFKLKNKSVHTLHIQEVETSCGCTSADYPMTVAGNNDFTISAEYNAETLGHFQKMLCVYSNGSKKPIILTIKGVVVSELKSFSGEYTYTLGNIKTDVHNVEFDNVNIGDNPKQKIYMLNTSEETAEPVFMHLPNYLEVEMYPAKIAPHHTGVAVLSLDSKKLHDLGLNQTDIYLGFAPGDTVADDKLITVSSVLLPAFQNLTAKEIADAPKIKLSTDVLDLGSFKGKKKLKGDIEIKNSGKSVLEIRNLQMFTMGLEVSLNKTKIQPGESAKLKVSAYAEQIKNIRSKPRVLMITNDPSMSKVTIEIKVKK